jgi:hypothetical protein
MQKSKCRIGIIRAIRDISVINTPPKNRIIVTVDAQPATGFEKIRLRTTINIIKINAMIENNTPKNVDIDRGSAVNATIPSIE